MASEESVAVEIVPVVPVALGAPPRGGGGGGVHRGVHSPLRSLDPRRAALLLVRHRRLGSLQLRVRDVHGAGGDPGRDRAVVAVGAGPTALLVVDPTVAMHRDGGADGVHGTNLRGRVQLETLGSPQ